MWGWTDDPVADAERYFAEQDEELEKLPKCCECGEPIQTDTYYEFDGDLYCEDCMDNHRHFTY